MALVAAGCVRVEEPEVLVEYQESQAVAEGGASSVPQQLQHRRSAFTRETVRSVISCSKARVSSACFWLCSAIFSLNFRGFEPPVPGEPDMMRAAVSQLQLLVVLEGLKKCC